MVVITKHFNRPEQTPRRRELRSSLSTAEAALWTKLSRRQFLGSKFRRQYGADNFVIDFYCPELKLAIEVDGSQHFERQAYDAKRQQVIEQYGITFIRVSSFEVCKNMDGVLEYISNLIQTTPTPPCQGVPMLQNS